MTRVGKPSLQCFTILRTTCVSSWTTRKGCSSVFLSAIAAKLRGAAMVMHCLLICKYGVVSGPSSVTKRQWQTLNLQSKTSAM